MTVINKTYCYILSNLTKWSTNNARREGQIFHHVYAVRNQFSIKVSYKVLTKFIARFSGNKKLG